MVAICHCGWITGEASGPSLSSLESHSEASLLRILPRLIQWGSLPEKEGMVNLYEQRYIGDAVDCAPLPGPSKTLYVARLL